MRVELKLVHRNARSRGEADAWFIPGESANDWLHEITSWQCATSTLRLLVVPQSQSRQPLGVVVMGAGTNRTSGRALAYHRVGRRLLIPSDAELFPYATESELLELLVSDSVDRYVWHPVSGLVGFESEETLTIDQLLTVGPQLGSIWRMGDAGVRLSDRIVSVRPAMTLTLNQILQQGGDDIGTESSLDDAPRSPDESQTAGIRDALRSLQRPFARAAESFAQSIPANADRRTWINALGEWAQRVLHEGSASHSRRMNELKRLMHMLQNDPDKGLRFAIPFGGDNHRGMAPAGDQLMDQGPLDYGNPGSGPAAYWDMPWQMQHELLARYRELAQRESRMGRHRRAAHIYANLLGDFQAAAAALHTGGHFREAAVLYKEKLGQTRKAADCLKAAGLWMEAVELYEQLGDWEKVAELYEEVDDHKHALLAWRKAVATCENRADYLRAAVLLEGKLGDIPAAIDALKAGWKASRKPKECLAALFELYVRREDSLGAKGQIEDLLEAQYDAPERQATASELLVDVSQKFPAPDVRHMAAGATRRLVARNLSLNLIRGRFLRVLESLHPGDRLLGRDCDRFQRDNRKKQPAKPTRDKIEFVSRIMLGKITTWHATASDTKHLYVAGYRESAFVVAAWEFDSAEQAEKVHFYMPDGVEPRIQMEAWEGPNRPLVIDLQTDVIRKDFTRKAGPVAEQIRNAPQPESLAMGIAEFGTVWLLERNDFGIQLSGYNPHDVPVGAHTIPRGMMPSLGGPAHLTVVGPYVCLAASSSLLIVDLSGQQNEVEALTVIDTNASETPVGFMLRELGHKVVSVSASLSRKKPAVAVSFEDGGRVVWLEDDETASFGHGLVRPITAFTEQNDLIAADAHGVIEVYRVTTGKVSLTGTVRPRSARVVGVETFDRGRFCVCYEDGTVDVYRLRR